MIIALVAVVVFVGLCLSKIMTSRNHRLARLAIFTLGVMVPALIVLAVVPAKQAIPFAILVTLIVLAVVFLFAWTISDLSASPAQR